MTHALRRKPLAVLLALVLALIVVPGRPANAASLPGLVLTSATASLPTELTTLATGKRLTYVTTDAKGVLSTATGLLLTPKTNKKNKVVVWGHGTTGIADKCAPSTNQSVFWPEARAAVAELLRRGWTVAAPDYQGLGTAQSHPYLVGLSEARSMIDSVKAARNLDSALGTSYAIDGHSQGGQGALFANQIATAYDGNLVLKGTATIAPVSNVDQLAPLIPGTPGQGYLVMGLYGLNAVESTYVPNNVLATPAEQKAAVLQSGCLYEILDAYAPLTADQLLTGGALPANWVAKLKQYDNPGQTATTAPILIVQGTLDDAVPAFITHDILLPQLQAYSQPVQYIELDGATHDSAVFDSTVTVANWIAARL
ncbi:MAG: alpha/beta fold hydrolase [Actinoplanes sp.]